MTARVLVALAVLGTTGFAVWSQGVAPRDPFLPLPAPPAVDIAAPVIPVVPQLGPVPLLAATAVPPPPTVPFISGPDIPRATDPLLNLDDRAGIDDMIRQLGQIREKKEEIERFERHLVSKLQEKVRKQAEKLKSMGVGVVEERGISKE